MLYVYNVKYEQPETMEAERAMCCGNSLSKTSAYVSALPLYRPLLRLTVSHSTRTSHFASNPRRGTIVLRPRTKGRDPHGRFNASLDEYIHRQKYYTAVRIHISI